MVSRTIPQPQTDVTLHEAARVQLMGWGALMTMVYLVFLLVFPLVPTIHQSDHILEIEQMLRHGRKWFAPFYVIGLGLLFFAFWRALNIVHRLSQEDPQAAKSLRGWVLGIGMLSGLVLIGLYPITALDVALYVVRARLWALYDGSPMLAVPSDFPQDPYIRMAGEYHDEVSPYGPVWELLAQIPMQLGILDIAGGVLAMKAIAFLSYVGMAILIGWYSRQDTSRLQVSGLTALTFFALNPLVLLEVIGNGHNDIVMLTFMTLGLVLWQRNHWAWATVALTLAALVKVTGLILLPLFGMAVLVSVPDWWARLLRASSMTAIFLLLTGIAYQLTGPFPDVFLGAQHVMFGRWGYTPVYMLRESARALFPPGDGATSIIANLSRAVFIAYFVFLLVQVARGKMTLIQAGFLAYFSQLLLGTTFRIWYPLWLISFAALGLNSHTFWRTFLFSITAELSILMYLILWRWILEDWAWGLNGPLSQYWKFWTVMTVITSPWVFGIPLVGPFLLKRRNPRRFSDALWI